MKNHVPVCSSVFGCLFFGMASLIAFAPSVSNAARSALPDAFDSEDLLWEITLGTHQYSVPKIDGDDLFIGINDTQLDHPAIKRTGGGILMCLDKNTGRMAWQLIIPRYMDGTKAPFHFNQWRCGICSSPAVDGKCLYIVGPRGEILCIDRKGRADGNDKPFLDEAAYMNLPEDSDYQLTKNDGDIIWRYDMIEELGVVPHDVCGSTLLLHGDYVYACTSNGQDDKHKYIVNPEAPSMIVLDKNTGRLVATDGELIGRRMFHGQWSSPVAATAGGREMIIFGGGDGVLYAFEPVNKAAADGKPLTLKKLWQHDCNPPEYRKLPYSGWRNKSPRGPSEVIAMPVVHNQRIYASIGQSPVHGPGDGQLSCIDAATGKKIWASRELGRSLSNVLIHRGLLYAVDFNGKLHCFDADSGQLIWQHELGAGVWSASPVAVDGKIIVGTEKNVLWVFKAGREKQVISRSRTRAMAITPVLDDGILYLPTQRRLFAIKVEQTSPKAGN